MSSSDYLFTRTFRPRTRIVPPWPWHHPGPFESPSDGSPCTPPPCPPRAISAPALSLSIIVLLLRRYYYLTLKTGFHHVERCVETRSDDRTDEATTERLHRRLELRGPIHESEVNRIPNANDRFREVRSLYPTIICRMSLFQHMYLFIISMF